MIDKEKTANQTDIFLESIKSSPQIIKGVERYLGKLLAKPLLRTGISANMVTFLCSERANFVNGALIEVDGGVTRAL